GLVERAGGARRDARAAGDAGAVDEGRVHPRHDLRAPAAARVGERERALDLVARANAASADDALVEIHLDVRVPVVLRIDVPLARVPAALEAEVTRDLA